MVRVRRNVDSPGGAEALAWYAKAVAVMMARPANDPTSWVYRAAVHGTNRRPDSFQNRCEHANWRFLPWHRAYLASFEGMVAEAVEGVGGPQEWALPYWDYTVPLAQNPEARRLPPPFRDRLDGTGALNPLWTPRAADGGGYFHWPDTTVGTSALNSRKFDGRTEFGGEPGFAGQLEQVPHNAVHRQSGGYMTDPNTAALDPIFWLHHCNIDRLWEKWRNSRPHIRHPDNAEWRTVPFAMHDGAGRPGAFTLREMLSTETVLHGYRYDDTPVAKEPPPAMGFLQEEPPPSLAGRSDASVPLNDQVIRTPVRLALSRAAASFADDGKPEVRHVYLALEHVVGQGVPADFEVFVAPMGAEPLYAGLLTTFGIERASDPDRAHDGGNGLNATFEITELAPSLGLTAAEPPSELEVTFVEQTVPDVADESPLLLPQAPTPPAGGSVTVGRIGLYLA